MQCKFVIERASNESSLETEMKNNVEEMLNMKRKSPIEQWVEDQRSRHLPVEIVTPYADDLLKNISVYKRGDVSDEGGYFTLSSHAERKNGTTLTLILDRREDKVYEWLYTEFKEILSLIPTAVFFREQDIYILSDSELRPYEQNGDQLLFCDFTGA